MLFIGFFFFLIGIAMLFYGIYSVIKMRRQLANSVKVAGRVFGFGTQIADGGNVYCPQVEFQIPSGKTIKFSIESRHTAAFL